MDRPDWTSYFMQIAQVVKSRSPDTKTKVGAVLVSLKDNRIISCGYNGLKAGLDDNIDWTDREFVHNVIIHAECNALLYAGSKFDDAVMYITLSPCKDCLKMLSAANIKKIVYKDEYHNVEEVRKLCDFLGIELIKY